MKKTDENQSDTSFSASKPSAMDLRGRQSVRATFRLSEACIDAITVLSTQLGIKQKSLFDHLIEDVQSLNAIANEIEDDVFEALERVQKTFVISRRTLSSLDETSKRFNAPRDALVEYSIQRLLPVITREREKHRKRKEILRDMNENMENGLRILQKSKTLLREDDPDFLRWKSDMKTLVNTQHDIEAFIEKGKIIEDFQAE